MNVSTLDRASTNTSIATQGWTFSSGGRGTFDIIWACFLTIFLCGWSTICVNVPSRNSNWLERLWRKFLVFCEALAGPEFIFHTALRWTTRHGFYAGMGGFILHSSDFVPFPLTLNQVHYLVAHDFVDFRTVLVDKSVIEDKNKFDTLTRILTTVQLFWFVINTIARVSLSMAITTLELSTIAFIFCTLFTCFCWRFKPQDVSTPITIELKVPLATVLTSAGPIASRPYSYTPLDFADENPHWFQLVWRYCFNIPRALGFKFHSMKRPIDKIWDDRFSHLSLGPSILLAFVQISFAAIHFAAWNFHFPSDVERILWRISASYIICSMLCTWIIIYATFELFPLLSKRPDQHQHIPRVRRQLAHSRHGSPFFLSPGWLCDLSCNNSQDQNPDENIPALAAATLVPLGVFYICFRMYIILEDIINLRELPASVYDEVNWSAFIPHF